MNYKEAIAEALSGRPTAKLLLKMYCPRCGKYSEVDEAILGTPTCDCCTVRLMPSDKSPLPTEPERGCDTRANPFYNTNHGRDW